MGAKGDHDVMMYKTDNDRPFDDMAILSVETTCPAVRKNQMEKFNQFRANIIFELPPNEKLLDFNRSKLKANVRDPSKIAQHIFAHSQKISH